jgi:hypothetical protein
MRSEAERLVTAGNERHLSLRLLGAIAFQFRCPKYNYLAARLQRTLSDVDFAAYSSQRGPIGDMMREFGYGDQPMVSGLFGGGRMIWDNKSNGLHVDIFFDKLDMNHEISFRGRLETEQTTIPLADLLLEKMQIVHINGKDIIDTIMLLREHQIEDSGAEGIDARYIAKLLSKDWGFYYTVTTNLKNVQDRLGSYSELTGEDRADVSQKIQKLTAILQNESKTIGWKARSRIGTKTQWYHDVDDVVR